MPTYSYACKDCDHRFDLQQAFSDDPLTTCPACGGALRKLYGSVGVVFKGSGFYRTDSRGGSAEPSSDGGGKKEGAGAGGGKDGASAPSGGKGGEAKGGEARPSEAKSKTKGGSTSSTGSAPAAAAG